MKPSDYKILDLIPQRPPMIMIDKLTDTHEKSARGSFFIKKSNPFCHNGYLSEAGLIECIAQTAAAYAGYLQLSAKKEVTRGYIGAIKNLVIHSLPAISTKIQSEIIVENELLGYSIINGKIFQKNVVIVECEIRILLDAPSLEK